MNTGTLDSSGGMFTLTLDDWKTIATIISLVLIPALTAWLTYRKAQRALKKDREAMLLGGEAQFREDIRNELTAIRQQNSELREKYEKLLLDHAELHGQFIALENSLRTKIMLFESAHQSLPIPQWLKDKDGKVLSINKEYEHVFLTPRGYAIVDYVGHDDYNVWPKEIAEQFRANDKRVWETGEQFEGIEMVPTKEGDPLPFHIIKYLRYAGNVKLGIAGIAFPLPVDSSND